MTDDMQFSYYYFSMVKCRYHKYLATFNAIMKKVSSIILCMFIFAFLISNCKREPASNHGPTLASPVNNAKMHIDSLYFSWNGTAGNSYLIEISSDNTFTNIIDSATSDSSKYFSALWYSAPINGQGPFATASNYIMGGIYYWRVIKTNLPTTTSSVLSFYIIDTRDSIMGTWSGTINNYYWSQGGTIRSDTIYPGTLVISKNPDGSISSNTIIVNLYPSTSNDYNFMNGCVSCFGSHAGATCVYNPATQTLTFTTGSGGMGGGGTTTFVGTQ